MTVPATAALEAGNSARPRPCSRRCRIRPVRPRRIRRRDPRRGRRPACARHEPVPRSTCRVSRSSPCPRYPCPHGLLRRRRWGRPSRCGCSRWATTPRFRASPSMPGMPNTLGDRGPLGAAELLDGAWPDQDGGHGRLVQQQAGATSDGRSPSSDTGLRRRRSGAAVRPPSLGSPPSPAIGAMIPAATHCANRGPPIPCQDSREPRRRQACRHWSDQGPCGHEQDEAEDRHRYLRAHRADLDLRPTTHRLGT